MRESTRKALKIILLSAICIGLGTGMIANRVYAFSPEDDLLKTKGYSPAMVKMTETQRSRQEWRDPGQPVLTPAQRFFHNIYFNNWVGPMDDFGSGIIRERQ